MHWLNRIEEFHNRLSDTRWVWFPFEILRPARDAVISVPRRAVMALAFGGYYAFFLTLRGWIAGDAGDALVIGRRFAMATVVLYAWFNVVTATFWNRRARRLAAHA